MGYLLHILLSNFNGVLLLLTGVVMGWTGLRIEVAMSGGLVLVRPANVTVAPPPPHAEARASASATATGSGSASASCSAIHILIDLRHSAQICVSVRGNFFKPCDDALSWVL